MRALVIIAIVGVGLGAITLWALEGDEVVVLRTRTMTETPRHTRIWIADADGVSWIESANVARPFYLDIETEAHVVLERGGRSHECNATIAPEPGGHVRIRSLLREKYGWRDWWIGWVADTSASRAVRLTCATT